MGLILGVGSGLFIILVLLAIALVVFYLTYKAESGTYWGFVIILIASLVLLYIYYSPRGDADKEFKVPELIQTIFFFFLTAGGLLALFCLMYFYLSEKMTAKKSVHIH